MAKKKAITPLSAENSAQQEKPSVQVSTLRCGGYSLSIQQEGKSDQEYMYWTAEELVIGMAAHLIDGIDGPMERGDMSDLVCDHIKQSRLYHSTLAKKEQTIRVKINENAKHTKEKNQLRTELSKANKLIKCYERKFGVL